jgi:hypothetical protein
MITTTKDRVTIGKAVALGFPLATFIAMLLSTTPPAGAATPSGKAFAWGGNEYGTLGNSNTPTDSDVPAAVKNLTGIKSVKNIDEGLYFSLAVTK